MSNTFKVTDLVANESLRIAHEKAQFIGTVDRQYDESFVMASGRAPHGSTLRVKNPNQYVTRDGNAMVTNDQDETTQTITVATIKGVDMKFNHQELMQSVANDGAFDDLSRNYIQPAISALVSTIESDFIAFCTKATWNVAGTAGTALTDLVAVGAARAKLNQNAAPKDGRRFIQCDSVAMGGMVNGLKGLFQDSAQIKEQYREGMIGRTSMADWYENDRMWNMTTMSTTNISTGKLNFQGFANGVSAVSTTLVGDPTTGQVFTVAGIYALHPETKAAFASLQQFTVLAGSTSTYMNIAPTIYTTGAKKNVGSVTGADLTAATVSSNAMTFVGGQTSTFTQQLMYHKEAFQFITGALPMMDDAQKCSVVKKDGLSLRAWMGSDIRNNELLMRIDILYGQAALRPAWASRIIGSAAS